MRRFIVILALAVAVIGAWWLAEDGDLRQRLTTMGNDVLNQAGGGSTASWGDVADKVGEFAKEERDLKATVGSLEVEENPAARSAPVEPGPVQ